MVCKSSTILPRASCSGLAASQLASHPSLLPRWAGLIIPKVRYTDTTLREPVNIRLRQGPSHELARPICASLPRCNPKNEKPNITPGLYSSRTFASRKILNWYNILSVSALFLAATTSQPSSSETQTQRSETRGIGAGPCQAILVTCQELAEHRGTILDGLKALRPASKHSGLSRIGRRTSQNARLWSLRHLHPVHSLLFPMSSTYVFQKLGPG